MSKIEEMKQYIERTKMSASTTSLYKMNVLETFELAYQALECRNLPIEAISLAFDYGKAKGYRAAKAEGRAAV